MKDPVQNVSRTAHGRAIRFVALALLAVVFAAGAAQAQVKAYVASTGNTSVLELDTATNTATATITGTGSRHLSFSRNGAFLYSTTFNAVQVINTATNAVIANIPTGNIATNVVESPNGFLYVCNNGSATVSIIDTTTYTVTSTLSPVACQTVAITPDGSSVWVSINDINNSFFPAITVIDTATNAIATTFPIGSVLANAPFWIAFSPDGAFAYAAGFPANSVSVIDTATHATVATVPVGSFPTFVALTPDGAFAYVANLTANSVSVIDTATNTVVATVPVGAFPRAIAFTPDGASAYVTNFNDNTISVIDTMTKAVVSTFPFGSRPWGIAITRLPNVPPVLASDNASVTVNEGQTAANTGTVTDANHDTVTLTASVGTVINNGNGTWSWSFLTSDPNQSQTVTITGDDGHGGVSHTSFALVVLNVPPTIVSISNNGPVFVGNPATITVVATDPAGANDPLTYSFDCNNDGIFEIGPQSGNSATCTFATVGSHTVNVRVADDDGGVTTGSTVVTVVFPPPNCANATASPNLLWPPNHKFVPITISGIVNPAPGAVTITVTSIFQDEPVQGPGSGNTSPDATGVGTSTPSVRAERDGGGDGRVYHINFTATGAGGSCTGSVTVGVPHDQGHGGPVDEGPLYDSTLP
jgi:YVTN family beta-propeller protein